MAEFDEQIIFEMGYNKGFGDGIKGSIPTADYENRLKADMVGMLTELDLQIDELSFSDEEPINITQDYIDEVKSWEYGKKDCKKLIQEKINALKENNND